MLVVKVFVNQKQIDELWIHNIGEKRGKAFYEICKPLGCGELLIEHKKSTGYRSLLLKVLKRLVGESE